MPKSARDTCPICIADVAPSRVATCPFCEYGACKTCTARFILSTADDPNCMNCHRIFDRETLADMLSQTFVNKDLKRHREHVLLDRETAMMPSTQPHVVQELQRRKNQERIDQMNRERRDLKRRIVELDRACRELARRETAPVEQEKRHFVHPCAQEGCKGFLSTAWKCGVCDRYTCSECNAPRSNERDDGHVCSEGDRTTFQMLKHDCKKCPTCGVFIHRVSGCDQMWCTQCCTAFSWRTGLKVNGGVIHNPHFYEFQRQNSALHREAGDIPCGGMPTQREMTSSLRRLGLVTEPIYAFMHGAHRLTMHVEHIEMPAHARHDINDRSNLDLRIKYMLNEISTDLFKERIQQREKRKQKMRDIYLILQMFVNTMSDLFRQCVIENEHTSKEPLMRALISYSNANLKRVSVKYACVVPYVKLEEEMRIDHLRFKSCD